MDSVGMRAGAALVAFVTSLALGGVAAWGQGRSQPVEGVVVEVHDKEVIVDMGREQGLRTDALVQVYRRVEVKHPVTKRKVVDRFPIGAMILDQVGSVLSISSRWGGLERGPAVGDFVVWEPEPAFQDREEPQVNAAVGEEEDAPEVAAPAPRDPALVALDESFRATLGQPLTERIAIWEGYIKKHRDSAFVGQVASELTWLRAELAAAREARAEMVEKPARARDLDATVSLPREVGVAQPAEIVAAVTEPERVEAVRMLLRRKGGVNYTTVPMTRQGDYYWRAELPAAWREVGTVEAVVEAVRADGQQELLAGTASSPRSIAIVERTEDPARRADRSKATVVVEAVNFKTGDIEDEYIRFESEYQYLVDFRALRAVRVGVGIFDGRGGRLSDLEAGEEARRLDVSYGFTELEIALHEYVGLATRVLLGNQGSSERDTLGQALGFRTQLRLGEAEGTSLVAGVALTDGLGSEGWIALNLAAIDRVPMEASVVVTNLPVGEDLGVSLNYGAGWAFTDWFALMARVGWNARTINHFGPTVGLGSTLTW